VLLPVKGSCADLAPGVIEVVDVTPCVTTVTGPVVVDSIVVLGETSMELDVVAPVVGAVVTTSVEAVTVVGVIVVVGATVVGATVVGATVVGAYVVDVQLHVCADAGPASPITAATATPDANAIRLARLPAIPMTRLTRISRALTLPGKKAT
jgi:hypothetical protein